MVVSDVDGVLTDGRIILGNDGEELKCFHPRDGLGIRLAQRAGIVFAIITGRESQIVTIRVRELGIEEVHQGIDDKWAVMAQLLEKYQLEPSQVAYIGDDLNDLAIIRRVGLGATVADGVAEVKRYADVVTKAKGGEGAVRELIELILKSQHRWKDLLRSMI